MCIKTALLLLCLIAVCVTEIPVARNDNKQTNIVSQYRQMRSDGHYIHSYEASNGIKAQEQGYVKNKGNKENEIQVARGSYSYIDSDGIPFTVYYIADENGFRVKFSHSILPSPVAGHIGDDYETYSEKLKNKT